MENMSIINKIPKNKDFFHQIRSENTNEVKSNRDKINHFKYISSDDLCKEDGKHNQIISNYILSLNETDFWNLINKRLGFPTSANEIKRVRDTSDIEYWTIAHLTDELFLQIAKTKEIIIYNGKKISIYKYYNQALRMWKWIPISKPKAKFIINILDLSPRIYSEIRNLNEFTAQYVLKDSVKRIFENIDFKFYHEHIEDNLEVVLDK
jgi:hypothetical protein